MTRIHYITTRDNVIAATGPPLQTKADSRSLGSLVAALKIEVLSNSALGEERLHSIILIYC